LILQKWFVVRWLLSEKAIALIIFNANLSVWKNIGFTMLPTILGR